MAEETVKTEEEVKKAAEAASVIEKDPPEDAGSTKKEPPEVEALKSQLAEQTKRAEQAERERDERRKSEETALTAAETNAKKAVTAQEESIANAANAAKSKFEAARRKLREARDSGNFDNEEEALIEFNDAQAQLRGAEYQKNQWDNWKKNGGDKKAEVVSRSESRFTKPEQDWIKRNDAFNTDPVFRGIVYAADEDAKKRGIVVDSDEYFSHIEKTLVDGGYDLKSGKRASRQAEADPDSKKETKRELSNTSSGAPPSGGSSSSMNGSGGNQRTFRMTTEHREAAAICYPDLHKKDPKAAEEKYAKRQLEIADLKSQGKL